MVEKKPEFTFKPENSHACKVMNSCWIILLDIIGPIGAPKLYCNRLCVTPNNIYTEFFIYSVREPLHYQQRSTGKVMFPLLVTEGKPADHFRHRSFRQCNLSHKPLIVLHFVAWVQVQVVPKCSELLIKACTWKWWWYL